MSNIPKIPVILVTGFLGSGKTTFLRRLAESHPDWHLVFLVNEFAELGVDGDTLAATGTPTQSVVGGSLFCECKAGEFLNVMRQQILPMHAATPLDAVVIETSGTADPEAIGHLFDAHGLSEHFELRRIATVVAPAKFLTLVENLPVIEAQLQASNLVIINKTDTASSETLAEVEAAIRILNPHTEIVRAEQCRFSFHLSDALTDLRDVALATCDANPFITKSIRLQHCLPHTPFLEWLNTLPLEILRAKGYVKTDQGSFHLERTVDNIELTPCEHPSQCALVLIAHDDDESILNQVTIHLQQIAQ